MLNKAFFRKRQLLHCAESGVILHPVAIMATRINSLQRSVSSVPKVAIVERFNCMLGHLFHMSKSFHDRSKTQ